jgi:hypothetical protein
MRAEELLDTLTDEELKRRANECFIKAERSNLYELPETAERQRLLTEADFYLKALIWRHDARITERDARIAERDFRLEKWVIILISVEILLSLIFGFLGLWEGWKQGKALDRQVSVLSHMDTSTAATSDSLQKLVAAQDASLKILQEEQAQRAKKPRLALYDGNIPIDKSTLQLASRTGLAQDTASFDLLVKNIGDAPVSMSRLHVLTPQGVGVAAEQLITVPEFGPPAHPNTQVLTLQLPLLPAGETYRLNFAVYAPKGHPAFKITFTVDAMELQAVAPLGSLTVLPPKL